MTDAGPTAIEIGLTAAIVAVDGDGELHDADDDVGGVGEAAGLTGLALRAVRSAFAHHTFEIGLRQLGQGSRPGSRSAMSSSSIPSAIVASRADQSDRRSRTWSRSAYLALTRRPEKRRRTARDGRRLHAVVSLLPVGGLACRPAGTFSTASIPPALDAWAQRETRDDPPQPARQPARAACAPVLRGRRQPVGRREGARPLRAALRGRPRRGGAPRRPARRARARRAAGARRADAARPSPHPRHRDRAAARQAQISSGDLRIDGADVHAHRVADHRRGDLRPPPAQAEFPPGPGRNRRHGREPTGETSTATGGRPAALFRFRREVVQERPAPGLRVGGRG